MSKYKVIFYSSINSDGRTGTQERVVTASSIIGAKQQASGLFPTRGKWSKLDNGEYVKGVSQIINEDRLFVIPLSKDDISEQRIHVNKLKSIADSLRTHFRDVLGWDNWDGQISVIEDKIDYEVFKIAEKKGYCVYMCEHPFTDPTAFQEAIRKLTYENIILFVQNNAWTWQLLRNKEHDDPYIVRIDAGEGSIPAIEFSLIDEYTLSLVDVCMKVDEIFGKPFRKESNLFTIKDNNV